MGSTAPDGMSVMAVHEAEEELKVRSSLSSFYLFPEAMLHCPHLPTWETRKEMIFSRISVVERNTGESGWNGCLVTQPTVLQNWSVPNSLFMVAPIQQLMVTYPFCSRISPITRQVCLHYWRWKYQISTVLGFLAAKLCKSPREIKPVSSSTWSQHHALPVTKTVQLHGSVYLYIFFLKIICVGFSGTWNQNYPS